MSHLIEVDDVNKPEPVITAVHDSSFSVAKLVTIHLGWTLVGIAIGGPFGAFAAAAAAQAQIYGKRQRA
jgi:hypothetical protein